MSAVPHTIDQSPRPVVQRWVAFNAVGLAGMLVQLAVVAVLVRVAGWHVLAATAVAVEAAVLHNFVWHQRWTWRDRPGDGVSILLLRFHLSNGLGSLAGNAVLMTLLVGAVGLPVVVANVIAVAGMSAVNFLLADRWVFGATGTNVVPRCAMAVVVFAAVPGWAAAQPPAEAVNAWQRYLAGIETDVNETRGATGWAAVAPAPDISAEGQSTSI